MESGKACGWGGDRDGLSDLLADIPLGSVNSADDNVARKEVVGTLAEFTRHSPHGQKGVVRQMGESLKENVVVEGDERWRVGLDLLAFALALRFLDGRRLGLVLALAFHGDVWMRMYCEDGEWMEWVEECDTEYRGRLLSS